MSPLPWNSFPPVVNGGNRWLLLKIKDAAGRKYGAQTGTFPIKGLLRACRYQYHEVAKRWEKSIAQEMFKIDSIKAESWAGAATDVEANFYDESETLLASYKIDRGQWTVVVDRWDLMKKLVFDATDTTSDGGDTIADGAN